jgi:hypothetical protein
MVNPLNRHDKLVFFAGLDFCARLARRSCGKSGSDPIFGLHLERRRQPERERREGDKQRHKY